MQIGVAGFAKTSHSVPELLDLKHKHCCNPSATSSPIRIGRSTDPPRGPSWNGSSIWRTIQTVLGGVVALEPPVGKFIVIILQGTTVSSKKR